MSDPTSLAQTANVSRGGWREIRRTLTTAVLAAIILALVAVAWSAVTGGSLAGLVGGTSRSDLASATGAVLPRGALLLVDDPSGCPPGWTDLGATDADRFAGRTPLAVGAAETRRYDHRDTGGAETVALTLSQMPRHVHNLLTEEVALRQPPAAGDTTTGSTDTVRLLAPGRARALDTCRSCTGWATQTTQQLDATSPPVPIPNMPPYVALYFCRKG